MEEWLWVIVSVAVLAAVFWWGTRQSGHLSKDMRESDKDNKKAEDRLLDQSVDQPPVDHVRETVIGQTIGQISQREELVDDCELVAVIAAAIAAAEGYVSADGLVVRSIRARRMSPARWYY